MSDKCMTLMIGCPGSGKSTLAASMKQAAEAEGKTCVICSTDDFFVVDGVYIFDADKLFRNHRANQDKARQACQDGIDLVIIDNTNIRREHRQSYEDIAAEFGHAMRNIVVGEFTEEFAKVCAARNKHNVPLESILKMARRVQLPEVADEPV